MACASTLGDVSIGERIKAARELVPGLSTKELDRLAGLASGITWSLENRPKQRSHEVRALDLLARVLGLSLDYLIRGDGESPKAKTVIDAVTRARIAAHDAAKQSGGSAA
jgi:hypothetical protein